MSNENAVIEGTTDATDVEAPAAIAGKLNEQGFAICQFGSGDDAGLVIVKAKVNAEGKFDKAGTLKEVFRLTDVLIQIPVTDAAINACSAKYTFTATDVDGVEHKLVGPAAATASKFLHAMESLRGEIRSDFENGTLQSEEYYRTRFAEFNSFGGGSRSGRKVPTLAKDEADKMSLAEMREWMAKNGLVRA